MAEVKQYAAPVEANNVITAEVGTITLANYSDLIPGVDMGGTVELESYVTAYGDSALPPAQGSYGALVQTARLLDGYAEQTFRRIRVFSGGAWSNFYPWERTDDENEDQQTEYGNHTLELDDAGEMVALQNAAVVTVPTNAQVAIPVGVKVRLLQRGTGEVTVVPSDPKVQIRHRAAVARLAGQWAVATLHKISLNEWVLYGDLA